MRERISVRLVKVSEGKVSWKDKQDEVRIVHYVVYCQNLCLDEKGNSAVHFLDLKEDEDVDQNNFVRKIVLIKSFVVDVYVGDLYRMDKDVQVKVFGVVIKSFVLL